jgi:hypothetical protein
MEEILGMLLPRALEVLTIFSLQMQLLAIYQVVIIYLKLLMGD